MVKLNSYDSNHSFSPFCTNDFQQKSLSLYNVQIYSRNQIQLQLFTALNFYARFNKNRAQRQDDCSLKIRLCLCLKWELMREGIHSVKCKTGLKESCNCTRQNRQRSREMENITLRSNDGWRCGEYIHRFTTMNI